jgi:hypothetical protein
MTPSIGSLDRSTVTRCYLGMQNSASFQCHVGCAVPGDGCTVLLNGIPLIGLRSLCHPISPSDLGAFSCLGGVLLWNCAAGR